MSNCGRAAGNTAAVVDPLGGSMDLVWGNNDSFNFVCVGGGEATGSKRMCVPPALMHIGTTGPC